MSTNIYNCLFRIPSKINNAISYEILGSITDPISSRIVFVSFARTATGGVPEVAGCRKFRVSARRAATHRGDDAAAVAADAGDDADGGDDDS